MPRRHSQNRKRLHLTLIESFKSALPPKPEVHGKPSSIQSQSIALTGKPLLSAAVVVVQPIGIHTTTTQQSISSLPSQVEILNERWRLVKGYFYPFSRHCYG